MKKTTRKLVLSTHTIKQLDSRALRNFAGGVEVTTSVLEDLTVTGTDYCSLHSHRLTCGRPIMHDGCILGPAVSGLVPFACAEDLAVRDYFAAAAQLEASSIWTFLRLGAELAAVGAP